MHDIRAALQLFLRVSLAVEKHQRSRKDNKLGEVKRQDTDLTQADVMQCTLLPHFNLGRGLAGLATTGSWEFSMMSGELCNAALFQDCGCRA